MAASRTNIQISHNGVAQGTNRFTSTYRSSNSLHAQPINLSQRAGNSFVQRRTSHDHNVAKHKFSNLGTDVNNSRAELRKANFILGNNHEQIRSTNQSALAQHSIPADNSNIENR